MRFTFRTVATLGLLLLTLSEKAYSQTTLPSPTASATKVIQTAPLAPTTSIRTAIQTAPAAPTPYATQETQTAPPAPTMQSTMPPAAPTVGAAIPTPLPTTGVVVTATVSTDGPGSDTPAPAKCGDADGDDATKGCNKFTCASGKHCVPVVKRKQDANKTQYFGCTCQDTARGASCTKVAPFNLFIPAGPEGEALKTAMDAVNETICENVGRCKSFAPDKPLLATDYKCVKGTKTYCECKGKDCVTEGEAPACYGMCFKQDAKGQQVIDTRMLCVNGADNKCECGLHCYLADPNDCGKGSCPSGAGTSCQRQERTVVGKVRASCQCLPKPK